MAIESLSSIPDPSQGKPVVPIKQDVRNFLEMQLANIKPSPLVSPSDLPKDASSLKYLPFYGAGPKLTSSYTAVLGAAITPPTSNSASSISTMLNNMTDEQVKNWANMALPDEASDEMRNLQEAAQEKRISYILELVDEMTPEEIELNASPPLLDASAPFDMRVLQLEAMRVYASQSHVENIPQNQTSSGAEVPAEPLKNVGNETLQSNAEKPKAVNKDAPQSNTEKPQPTGGKKAPKLDLPTLELRRAGRQEQAKVDLDTLKEVQNRVNSMPQDELLKVAQKKPRFTEGPRARLTHNLAKRRLDQ